MVTLEPRIHFANGARGLFLPGVGVDDPYVQIVGAPVGDQLQSAGLQCETITPWESLAVAEASSLSVAGRPTGVQD